MPDINKLDVEDCALPKGTQQYDEPFLNPPTGPQPLSADMKAVNTNMALPTVMKKYPFENGPYGKE